GPSWNPGRSQNFPRVAEKAAELSVQYATAPETSFPPARAGFIQRTARRSAAQGTRRIMRCVLPLEKLGAPRSSTGSLVARSQRSVRHRAPRLPRSVDLDASGWSASMLRRRDLRHPPDRRPSMPSLSPRSTHTEEPLRAWLPGPLQPLATVA